MTFFLPSRAKPWPDGAWFWVWITGLVLVFLLSTNSIENFDLGTDLKTGQWMLQNKAFPAKDAFTYTVRQNDYLDGKTLYQAALYLAYLGGGYDGIVVANSLITIMVFLLLWLRLRCEKCRDWLSVLLLILTALAVERRFFVRAEIVSWLFMSLVLWILERRESGKKSPLFLLPLLQWVWIYVEGLFILGWFAMAAYLAGTWFNRKAPDKALLKCFALSLVLPLLNPYGYRLYLLPFTYFSQFGFTANSDLVSPLKYLAAQNLSVDLNLHIFLYFLFSFLLVLAFATAPKRRKLHEWIMAAGFFYLACVGYRNIPLFFLATLPLLSKSAGQCPRLQGFWASADKFCARSAAPLLAGAFLFLLCLRIMTGAYYDSDRRSKHFGLGLDREQISVQAVQFLSENRLDARLLNDMGTGDWLVWRGPSPVFIDGRQQVMGTAFYREYLDTFQPGGLERAIARYQPKLIVCQYNDAVPWAVQIYSMTGWRLIHADSSAAVYASNDYALNIPAFRFSKALEQYRVRLGQQDIEKIVEDSKPSAVSKWFSGFYEPQKYPFHLQNLGLFALHYKQFEASQAFFAESLRQAGGNYFEVFYNLAVASLNLKQYHLGKVCLQKALLLEPNDEKTLQMLKSLELF
jgi:hypothetical protein